MVITVELENYAVKKVLINQGNSVDILYWATYQKLQLPTITMVPYDEPIYGFSREKVSSRGYIDLHTVFCDGAQTKTIPLRFLVIDALHHTLFFSAGHPSTLIVGHLNDEFQIKYPTLLQYYHLV